MPAYQSYVDLFVQSDLSRLPVNIFRGYFARPWNLIEMNYSEPSGTLPGDDLIELDIEEFSFANLSLIDCSSSCIFSFSGCMTFKFATASLN